MLIFDLIGLQPIPSFSFHGGGEYGKSLFREVASIIPSKNLKCLYLTSRQEDKDIWKICASKKIELIPVARIEEIPDVLVDQGNPVFYSFLPYDYYKLDFGSIPVVFTIHGLRDCEMPTDVYEVLWETRPKSIMLYLYKHIFRKRFLIKVQEKFQRLVSVSSKIEIVVVSEHTKYSLLSFVPWINLDTIRVFYPRVLKVPTDDGFSVEDEFLVESKNYFLIIMANRWIKNAYRAVHALDELYSEHCSKIKQKTLVLGCTNPEKFGKISNTDKFVFKGYVNEAKLERLFKEAFCFIYPTLNEGFGLPPLDAMKYGVPVLCSGIASLPEISQDAVIYFNPYSRSELKNRILRVIFDKQYATSIAEQGQERYCQVMARCDSDFYALANYLKEKSISLNDT